MRTERGPFSCRLAGRIARGLALSVLSTLPALALAQQAGGSSLPLVVAHALIDTVAFVGYALLHGRVGWLP